MSVGVFTEVTIWVIAIPVCGHQRLLKNLNHLSTAGDFRIVRRYGWKPFWYQRSSALQAPMRDTYPIRIWIGAGPTLVEDFQQRQVMQAPVRLDLARIWHTWRFQIFLYGWWPSDRAHGYLIPRMWCCRCRLYQQNAIRPCGLQSNRWFGGRECR